ncbi:MAG: IS21 family transposase [Chromatiales bacterium 21-64-14]|nr:MAG: IS21 family transposase [Chromatiales bacterium 21-64-14]
MPAERLSMRKIREVLRLKWDGGVSNRRIAQSCAIGRPAVTEYLRRAADAGLSWPLPADLDDAALERRLFPRPASLPADLRTVPDWAQMHQELKRKGVTLVLLWQEYKVTCPEGYQYSAFCMHYRAWRGTRDVVMRQSHRAGERLFVDYCGPTMPVIDSSSGEIHTAQIFVAVLGASNYTYAEATWTQTLPDWISAHVRAFAFFGGSPALLVPDNLKSAVTRAHRYEPDLNPTCQEMAAHYGVAVLPARACKPRDKAKVEAGVLLVERWILARLRHQTFFSLAELNLAIAQLLADLNRRPFKKLPGSRQEWFDTLERPALQPLPDTPYDYAEWKKARVNIDYHIEVEGHYYSVPYQLVKQTLDVRIGAQVVECLHQGKRVASHRRAHSKGRHTTVTEHMPRAHQQYAQWTPQRLVRWAQQTGAATARVVEAILASRPHPQHGFRSCLGILRLGKTYGDTRLESACQRALVLGAPSYRSIESILKRGLDRTPLPEPASAADAIDHPNIRGPEYYH